MAGIVVTDVRLNRLILGLPFEITLSDFALGIRHGDYVAAFVKSRVSPGA